MVDAALRIRQMHFAWPGQAELLAIDQLSIARGKRVFLKGPSGSGKSTLLGLIAGVNTVTDGGIDVLGHPMHTLGAAARDAVRAENMGVIFQLFNLVPYLSPVENVLLPIWFSSARAKRVECSPENEARRLLGQLGLDSETLTKPSIDLSVGQQQRVAVARALIGKPGLVIADEPTSALDHDARDAFIDLLMSECAAAGTTLLFVSHDASLAPHFDQTLDLNELNQAKERG